MAPPRKLLPVFLLPKWIFSSRTIPALIQLEGLKWNVVLGNALLRWEVLDGCEAEVRAMGDSTLGWAGFETLKQIKQHQNNVQGAQTM